MGVSMSSAYSRSHRARSKKHPSPASRFGDMLGSRRRMRDTIDIVPPEFREYVGLRPPVEDPLQRATIMAYIARTYFQSIVPTCFSRHDVNNACMVRWTWATDEFREKQRHDLDRYKAVLYELARNGDLTDRIYAMGVEEFRSAMGITDAQLPVP